jgi:hypothetical protein
MGSYLWMEAVVCHHQLIHTERLQLAIEWAFSTHEPKRANAFREDLFPLPSW